MKVKAVVFDLDGTLVNTLADISAAMNGALEEMNLPGWEIDDYKYLVGNGARKLAERAVREKTELTEAVLDSYQRRYEKHNTDLSAPYEGIPELLRSLKDRGVRISVLTNKPDADARRVLAFYFPDIVFDSVHGQREGVPVKPDPAGAYEISRELGIPADEFFYLGDTAVDMTCAVRAGMRPVGVLWGFRTRKELEESGAEIIISRPEELLGRL